MSIYVSTDFLMDACSMEILELEYSLLPLLNLKLAEDVVYQVSLQTNMREMLEHHAALFHISMKIVFLSGVVYWWCCIFGVHLLELYSVWVHKLQRS